MDFQSASITFYIGYFFLWQIDTMQGLNKSIGNDHLKPMILKRPTGKLNRKCFKQKSLKDRNSLFNIFKNSKLKTKLYMYSQILKVR